MATVKFILVLVEVLLLFNLLIAVHELGHFLAAKWRGLKIDRFAIWFGKPIWKKKINGVEYALGWIPAGGYVALPQMATMEAIEGKGETPVEQLPPVAPLDKIIVAFAGPLFSFALACLFAIVVWFVGRPYNNFNTTTTVGWVQQTDKKGNPGPAWKAGIRPGDTITSIDRHPVKQFHGPDEDSITWNIITSVGTNIEISYVRDGSEHTAYAVPFKEERPWYQRQGLRQLLIAPVLDPVIGNLTTNSPAAAAGLLPGDRILKADGEKIHSAQMISTLEESMTNGATRPVTLTILRGRDELEKVLTPEKPLKPERAGPMFGIEWQINTNVTIKNPSPADQIGESAGMIFRTLSAVFRPKSDVGVQQLGGAVMIVRVYSNLFRSEHGWRQVLWFSVLLNVNLALLNLFPIPVLDGGHIVLALLEAIRRKPVSARILQYIQTGFALVLIVFMAFIAFYDTGDWFRSARQDREDSQPIVFAPKN